MLLTVSSFNEAGAFAPDKAAHTTREVIQHNLASMRPELLLRIRTVSIIVISVLHKSFNEAGAFAPDKGLLTNVGDGFHAWLQ